MFNNEKEIISTNGKENERKAAINTQVEASKRNVPAELRNLNKGTLIPHLNGRSEKCRND